MSRITLSQLHDLPATIDLMTAARVLGIGRTKAYELARTDQFPCHVLRVGELYRVSTADLLRRIKADSDHQELPPSAA